MITTVLSDFSEVEDFINRNKSVLYVLDTADKTSAFVRDKPAQKRVREDISMLNSQINAMVQVRSSGLSLQVDANAIKKKKKEISDKEVKLKRFVLSGEIFLNFSKCKFVRFKLRSQMQSTKSVFEILFDVSHTLGYKMKQKDNENVG